MALLDIAIGNKYKSFDIVIGNTYFRIQRSGLPRNHRDIWRDETGDLSAYFMGLYFLVADNRPPKKMRA